MGEEAEALPGLSGVNLELHTGTPPSHALGPQDGSRRLPGAMGGAPQVLERDCVRALIDKGGQETRGNRGQKEQEKGQKGVPFLNFKEFYFCF